MNLQFVCGLKFRVFFDGVKIFDRINIAALFIFSSCVQKIQGMMF